VEGHEQVAQGVQRNRRDAQVAGGRRHIGDAVAVPRLAVRGDTLHQVVEARLNSALRQVGIELVGDVGFLWRQAGLARQHAVTPAQAEKEA